MRKISYIIKLFTLLALFSLPACDLLDKDIDTDLTKEQVFSDDRLAPGFLYSAYREIINGYNRIDGGVMFACASDEAISSNSGSSIHAYNKGSINPMNNPEEEIWGRMYTGIRKANMFLGELDKTIQEAGLIDQTNTTRANYRRMRGEALFLRAYYHFELAKRWGNIQLVDTVLTEKTVLDVKQSTFTEAIRFIVNDCDSALFYMDALASSIPDDRLGRASAKSALALKSRALLYLASPWNNHSGDKELWKEAADVAFFLISNASSAGIALVPDRLAAAMPNIDYITSAYNREVLFASQYELYNFIEQYNFPPSFGGRGYTNPTQDLVDCFDMQGTQVFDPNNPYARRDLRFHLYFYYNGQEPIRNRPDSVFTYVGGKDGIGRSATATKTGYYMRKFTDFSLNLSRDERARRGWIHFRFAEIILNYCEAKNESLEIGEDALVTDATIYQQLNRLRTRAGVATYAANTLTKEKMREAIHKERRVELAFEEHRFWDVRRWKQGMKYFNGPIHGMEIHKTEDGSYTYNRIEVENRVYNPNMDWYPIPYAELLKNPKLKQNPGW